MTCPCGRSVDYSSPQVQADVEKAMRDFGDYVNVSDRGVTYKVWRPHLATHHVQRGSLSLDGCWERVPVA